ncbi:hypothetical protein [Nodosilinea sp. FACHB-13]|uniref:hypothetical protein n=1 Tax=Cyanophyceae TaxID=3028117 RepID=UPI00168435B3|nr:hypothetical protein [Nodosilinea sp. FACHB-13]MBD2108528.1 hypothetical protein [Nodosilinea sp. FACHB-13]
MVEPVTITAAVIVGLAITKFTEGAASEAGKKLVNQLWETIANRFKGRKNAATALAQLEANQGQAPEAEANLVRVLDGEIFEDDDFRNELEQIVKQIQTEAPTRLQDVLVGIKARNIRAKDVTAEVKSGEATHQRVASTLEATEDVDLGNVSAKQ